MKEFVKSVLYRIAPETTTAMMSARARTHSQKLIQSWGLGELTRKLIDRVGPVVQSGPFCGMTLTPMTYAEHLGPFLLGTYESELHPWLEVVCRSQYSQLLDIGAKFGYYAVGLARTHTTIPVLAFDTDWWARKATREMAVANKTSNVVPVGFCSAEWLNRNLQPGSFILSDCEGYEAELFTGCTSPALDSATAIVEIHDNLKPGVGDAVRKRFVGTHVISTVAVGPRGLPPVDLSFLTEGERHSAMTEVRGPQEWLFLTPRPGRDPAPETPTTHERKNDEPR